MSLNNDVSERRMSIGRGHFALLGRDFKQILEQIISIRRIKTLSNTKLVESRRIESEKGSLPE